MSKVWVTKKDFDDIQRVLEKFPEVERFQLHEHSQSSVGSCLDMIFETQINDIKCKMVVPIIDIIDSW